MLNLNIKKYGIESTGKIKNQLSKLYDLLFPKGREAELSGQIRNEPGNNEEKFGTKTIIKL